MLPQNEEYQALLASLKERIKTAQLRAGLAVNAELVTLYWHIGREILDRQKRLGWGAKVIEQASRDLTRAFPGMKGFSSRNLMYMRAFAQEYPEQEFVQAALAQITWYHNITLLDKVKDREERLWYIKKTTAHGWSRNVLVHQIESGLYHRQGRALTNFERSLPKPQSDLAREILKNPYTFDFLTVGEDAQEREIENALVRHIKDFLLELGKGFAFVGSQYHLDVGGQDFYLATVDDLLRHTDDSPAPASSANKKMSPWPGEEEKARRTGLERGQAVGGWTTVSAPPSTSLPAPFELFHRTLGRIWQ